MFGLAILSSLLVRRKDIITTVSGRELYKLSCDVIKTLLAQGMAQRIKVLAAKPDDLSLISGTYKVEEKK